MIIAVDGMGGDNAPQAVIEGVYQALEAFPELTIHLYGQQQVMQPYLKAHERIQIVECSEVVEATDDAARAVRRKKDSSMARILQAVKEKQADACLSAGNTGALMAGGLFQVGRIEGIARPALATTPPTIDGTGFLMLDLGGNADPKPEHLAQYAVMGNVYAQKVRKLTQPRVGLLNIGTEEQKGNELTKAAFPLIQQQTLQFVGNVESRELLNGVADVVVTDGFTGNMVLKSIEGTAVTMFTMLKEAFTSSTKAKLGAVLAKDGLRGIKTKMDYTEYGGAALFGLKAPVIKAHGSSNAKAIFSALRQAKEMVEYDVTATIQQTIAKSN